MPVLHSYWRSSCSWRVRLALAHKKIPYAYRAVHLSKREQYFDDFTQLNPSSQVPVLEIDDIHISESVAILEYLEETRPQYPLLPSSPKLRAKVRTLVEIVNSGIQPKQNLVVNNYVEEHFGGLEARTRFAAHWIMKGLIAFERELGTTAGKCCVGDELSFADLCIVPQWYNAARFKVDITPYPRTKKIIEYLETLPAFEEAHPTKQPDAIP